MVLAAVRTAACMWWAILKEMAPKAALSFSSHTATSAAVMGGGPRPTVGHGMVPFTILQRFWLEPKLHLVNPDIVIGPIEDGDCYFDVVGSGGRHLLLMGF